MSAVIRECRVNEIAPDPSVAFDPKIGERYLRHAHMLAARGAGPADGRGSIRSPARASAHGASSRARSDR